MHDMACDDCTCSFLPPMFAWKPWIGRYILINALHRKLGLDTVGEADPGSVPPINRGSPPTQHTTGWHVSSGD